MGFDTDDILLKNFTKILVVLFFLYNIEQNTAK